MSLTISNGHAPQSAKWQTQSVRDFFGQMAWTGNSIKLSTPKSTPTTTSDSEASDMQLSVGEFFSRFAWDGTPNIAVPTAPLEFQPNLPSEDDITLDGFADLF